MPGEGIDPQGPSHENAPVPGSEEDGIASALAASIAMGGTGLAQAATAADSIASGTSHSQQLSYDDDIQARHGYVGGKSDVTARAAMKNNTGLGAIEWEPQSLEAPKGFPQAGPADGKIASAGTSLGANLDEQSPTRWAKNEIKPGEINIGWNFTAPHKTEKWHYYITKTGWNQNAPLTRAALEPLATIDHDGSAASNNPNHRVSLPADHTGYHIILAVWDVADTTNAFYNVIDVNISGDAGQPVDPIDPGQPELDIDAPTAPTHLHTMAVTTNSIDLMWGASTDNVAIDHYDIYRAPTDNGTFTRIGTTTATELRDTELTQSTTYQYKVLAVDTTGNTSTASNTITTKTDNPATATTWNPTATYTTGDHVTHNGSTYEALQTHQGNGDPGWINAPSLWKKI